MREHCGYVLLALLALLFVGAQQALAQSFSPLIPFHVDIYDWEQEEYIQEFPEAQFGYKEVSVTALFCVHPDINRSLLQMYAEQGYDVFLEAFVDFRNHGACEFTTIDHFLPLGPETVITVEYVQDDFVGPMHDGTEGLVIMGGLAGYEKENINPTFLYFVVPGRVAGWTQR